MKRFFCKRIQETHHDGNESHPFVVVYDVGVASRNAGNESLKELKIAEIKQLRDFLTTILENEGVE